jgi:hypothetical protein
MRAISSKKYNVSRYAFCEREPTAEVDEADEENVAAVCYELKMLRL